MLPLKLHYPGLLISFQAWLGHLRIAWKIWDLRTMILTSLFLQIILVTVAPFRKMTGNSVVKTTVWLAYLLADYIAIQAVGLIPKSNYSATNSTGVTTHPELLAFWATFLLVHLGGPDPITALSLEDNELWLRTVLHLLTYISAIARVFFQSLPTNIMFFPIFLMFLAGFCKYLERTSAMYYARLAGFRPSTVFLQRPEPHELYPGIQLVKAPGAPLTNVQLVKHAFLFFNKFKGVYADVTFNRFDWNYSRSYFRLLTPGKAFAVLESELNFTYEAFFTKMVVVHRKFGIATRCATFAFETASLVIWILLVDKQPFHEFDTRITWALLFGAVGIDSISILVLALSDWQVANSGTRTASFYENLLSARNRTWGLEGSSAWQSVRRMLFRQWSDSVYQYSLMNQILNPWPKCVNSLAIKHKWFANDLRDFIFDEVKRKADSPNDLTETGNLCDSKGGWVLGSLRLDQSFIDMWITDFEYDESLITWHLATELLYKTDTLVSDYRNHSKTLSDYMMYLLNWQPGIMSSVAGINIELSFRDLSSTLQDTNKEATSYFGQVVDEAKKGKWGKDSAVQRACEWLLRERSEMEVTVSFGCPRDSALYKAVRLAKELRKVRGSSVGMWEVIAKVWVELLSYTASHCRAATHAAQLRHGGELLTLVWLLMLHFGLAKQFRDTKR